MATIDPDVLQLLLDETVTQCQEYGDRVVAMSAVDDEARSQAIDAMQSYPGFMKFAPPVMKIAIAPEQADAFSITLLSSLTPELLGDLFKRFNEYLAATGHSQYKLPAVKVPSYSGSSIVVPLVPSPEEFRQALITALVQSWLTRIASQQITAPQPPQPLRELV